MTNLLDRFLLSTKTVSILFINSTLITRGFKTPRIYKATPPPILFYLTKLKIAEPVKLNSAVKSVIRIQPRLRDGDDVQVFRHSKFFQVY